VQREDIAMNATSVRARAPIHLWIVGVLGLLWTGMGVGDYTMSKLQGEAWYAQAGMSEAQIAYMNAMPAWATALWALGVWSAFLGVVLLLLRSRHAVPVFVASLVIYVLSAGSGWLVLGGGEVMGGAGNIAFQLAILAGCIFFWLYSRAMAERGVLS
jgi:hypothetical protein